MRVHLERLLELEYLELRHGRLGSPFSYELMMDAAAPEAVAHIGLIDVATLRAAHNYDGKVADFKAGVAGGGKALPPPVQQTVLRGETRAPGPGVAAWREHTSGSPALAAAS